MLIVGVLSFFAAELLYGSRGPDSGLVQFVLYGLVGFIPGVICSWLAHEAIDEPATVVHEQPAVESKIGTKWPARR